MKSKNLLAIIIFWLAPFFIMAQPFGQLVKKFPIIHAGVVGSCNNNYLFIGSSTRDTIFIYNLNTGSYIGYKKVGFAFTGWPTTERYAFIATTNYSLVQYNLADIVNWSVVKTATGLDQGWVTKLGQDTSMIAWVGHWARTFQLIDVTGNQFEMTCKVNNGGNSYTGARYGNYIYIGNAYQSNTRINITNSTNCTVETYAGSCSVESTVSNSGYILHRYDYCNTPQLYLHNQQNQLTGTLSGSAIHTKIAIPDDYILVGNTNSNNQVLYHIYDGTFNHPVKTVFNNTLGDYTLNSSYIIRVVNDSCEVYSRFAPNTQASTLTFSNVQTTQLTFNWADGNGSKRAVFMKQDSTGNPVPVYNTTYSANTVFGSGSQIGSSGWFCVFNGTSQAAGVTVTNLSSNTKYRVMVCEYNGTSGTEQYNLSITLNNPLSQSTKRRMWHVSISGSDETGTGSPVNPFKSIQKGIQVAAINDTVVVNKGTYFENINFNSKKIIVTSTFMFNPLINNIDSTIIDGNSLGSVVTIGGGATINGFTIQHGNYYDGGGVRGGGGTLSNLIIKNNQAWRGAGVGSFNGSGPMTIKNVLIHDNVASSAAGAIYGNLTDLTVINVTICRNQPGAIFMVMNNTIKMFNSVVWNIWPFSWEQSGNVFYSEYNDIKGGYAAANGSIVMHWGSGNIDVNPNFIDSISKLNLANNSLCIGAGSAGIIIEGNIITAPEFDLQGNSRPSPAASNPDIGCFENPLAIPNLFPINQSSNIVFQTIQPSEIHFNWTDGNGSKRAVFIKQDSVGSSTPENNTTYTANSVFGSGSQIGETGWYCVFNGSTHPTGVTVTGLSPNSNYRVMVFEYNGVTGGELYNNSTSINNPLNQRTCPNIIPTITGSDSVCLGSGNNSYSTELSMVGYNWSVSPGGQIISGAGTNTVSVAWNTGGAQTISVSYGNAAGCSAPSPTTLNVNVIDIPGSAGAISGPVEVCVGTQGVTYSIIPVPNATSYLWEIPMGATITAGAGSNSITVNISNSAFVGDFLVKGTNACFNGAASPILTMTANALLTGQVVLNNITIPPAHEECLAAQSITTAGSGTTFLIQGGGDVTLIASQFIHLLPGTTVLENGLLHAFITTQCIPCSSLKTPMSDTTLLIATQTFDHETTLGIQPAIMVYPNPTAGIFTIELNGVSKKSKILVEIYSLQGDKILNKDLTGEIKHIFSLSERPVGIYFVRIVTDATAKTVKVIRQ